MHEYCAFIRFTYCNWAFWRLNWTQTNMFWPLRASFSKNNELRSLPFTKPPPVDHRWPFNYEAKTCRMAMHGIINEHARGTTSHEQAANTHTFADIYRSVWIRRMYTHLHARIDTHLPAHTTRLLAYLLIKQCLLRSPLLTPPLHQSIEPALRDPVKPRHLKWFQVQ